MKYVPLKEMAKVDISNVDKKYKDGETEVLLCNFVDVYHKWAITKELVPILMKATANKAQIERFSIHKGQVAITKDSETRDDIGIPTYIADDIENGVLGYHCALITPNETILRGKYLNIVLHSPYARKYFEANASGSGQRYTLTNEIIEGFPVPLPDDISIQDSFGRLCSDIDKKISINTSICSDLESMSKLLYDYWFVQFDFPDENGKPYKSSGGKMVWNEELKREIPEGWKSTTVLESNIYTSDFTANGSFAGLAENVKYNEGDPYAVLVRIVDYNDNFADSSKFVYVNKHGYDYLRTCSLHGGEIIICNVGNVGITFRCPDLGMPMTLGPNGIVVNSEEYNDYLYLFYSSDEGQQKIRKISSGSIQKKFNKTDFRNMPILLPPQQINKMFKEHYVMIRDALNNAWHENRQLASLRDFLLPMLMNGQVKVGA